MASENIKYIHLGNDENWNQAKIIRFLKGLVKSMSNYKYVNIKYFRYKIILIGLPQMICSQLAVMYEVRQFPPVWSKET